MSGLLHDRRAPLLARLVPFQPGEGQRLALLVIYAAAFNGGVATIGYEGVGTALFLSRLPPTATPYILILPAIAVTLTLLLYNRAAARVRLIPLVLGATALLAVSALGLRLLLATPLHSTFGLLAGIQLFCETAMNLVGIQFWGLAARVFDPRQARRLFPVIAASGAL